MNTSTKPSSWANVALVLVLSGCSTSAGTQAGSVAVRPGAPGEPTRELAADEVRPPAPEVITEADVLFMQGMIPHHAQALTMSGLARTRTDSEVLLRLVDRIERSQQDEISFMVGWLEDQGAEVPDAGSMHSMHMPGMLTDEEMSELEAASGDAFDRLFLTYMIRHHDGALIMVNELFDSDGAAQDTVVFEYAVGVDGDQRAEIARMLRMLEELQ